MKLILYFTSLFLCISWAYAEITLDGTLGTSGALPGPHYAIGAELGQQLGDNLFHSFSQFNLNSDESATFSGPENISNIFSRVTGGYPSNINGLIRSTLPHADFYLINPAGLVFGPQASLDVQGSFHISTANALLFQDGNEFNASQPNNSSLTIAPITAFGFFTDSPADLSIDSSHLTVPVGKTLSLIGNNFSFSHAQLTSPSGYLNLASIAGKGKVGLQDHELTLSAPRGKITALDSQISTSGEGGGAIYIRAGQLLLDNTQVTANTLGATAAQGIDVQVDELAGSRGGYLSSSTLGTGTGGKVQINATGSVTFSGENSEGKLSGIQAQSGSPTDKDAKNAGNAGNIVLEAKQLNLAAGAQISSTTFGTGQGGNLFLTINGDTQLTGDNQSGLFTSGIIADAEGKTDSAGNAGRILLTTRRLHIQDGARILAVTLGKGQGGQIDIKVAQEIIIAGRGKPRTTSSGRISQQRSSISTTSFDQGQGGNLDLTAGELQLKAGGIIDASTQNVGQAGTIHIEIAGDLNISGGGGISTISTNGKAGDLILRSQQLILQESGQIIAMTFGKEKGGDIQIQANQVNLKGASTISAASSDQGDAGQVELNIGESLRMQNSVIETKTQQADGGSIIITSPGYLYLVGSQITTSVQGEKGDGGNITLKPEFILLNNALIQANAFEGNGGNIDITVTGLYKLSPSVIEASSQYGINGEITVNSPDAQLNESLIILQSEFLDASHLLQNICSNLRSAEEKSNTFVVVPLVGSSLSPADWQPSTSLSIAQQTSTNTSAPFPSRLTVKNSKKLLHVNCTKPSATS
ncbi:large exoprotein containing haemagglutination activity domain [Thioploca ingrica]|uniref:Large exoprotein containing haemagglutination activity domain n=1 Tax=Thioploca ingrica TaxID=40754 RepID=A0A090AG34_9GAMM|nr:large exoprotein containing haemagglutination activity domain [Thioploca ingrica]